MEEESSDSLSLSVVPYQPREMPIHSDLNIAPPNWLRPVGPKLKTPKIRKKTGRKEKMTSMLVANHYFEDHIPTELHDLNGIDAVAAADTIKQLVKLGKSSEHVSLLIHRIGDSLFMDDFDLEKLFRDTSSKTHHWFKSYLSEILAKEGNLNQLENELISALTKHLRSTSMKALESKFLYHSLMPSGNDQETRQQPCGNEGCFLQNNVWKFHDLAFLVGSDIPIFGNKNHPAVTLRLTDSQEINVLTGIDYWLENLMFSVPEVVMCFHIKGIVEKYENISTDDIPKLAGFDPEMVKTTAKSILSFLKSKCTEPGHTYWLFKEKNDDVVKLYDLSSLCDKTKEEAKPQMKKTANPYVTPVANLLLKLVKNLETETETIPLSEKKLRDENDENVTKLLHQALQISDDLPEVREKVLRKLAFRMSRKKYETPNRKSTGSGTRTRKPSQNIKEKTKGGTCVISSVKTSDIVNQYVQNPQATTDANKNRNDLDEDLKWISAACQLLNRNEDPTDVYLAFSSALATFAEREQVGTKAKEEELALILLAIRCILYSEPRDSSQQRTRDANLTILTERAADLQIPVLEKINLGELRKKLLQKYPSASSNLVNFLLSTFENTINKRIESELGKFLARDYKDVIQLYDLIKHHHQNKGTVHRKIAYVYNEMGKRIIDGLIIASIESNNREKPNDFSSDEFRNSGLSAFEAACSIFDRWNDTSNYALCQANMGRLYQVLSSVNKPDGELGELEEQDLNLSIKHYRKAVDTVKDSKMQENFTWDLINAQLKLATMLQECPPVSRCSIRELERKLIEILDLAEKYASNILRTTSQPHHGHLRLAEINYRIGAMHHGHIVKTGLQKKQLSHSIRLSEKYYLAAQKHFDAVNWKDQNQGWCVLHLRSTIERVALIKNHRNDKNRLLDALTVMLSSRASSDRLQQIDSKYQDDIISTVIKLVQMVLMELSKHISSFPAQYKSLKVIDVKNLILRCMKMEANIQTINIIMSDIEDLIC